MDQQSDYITFKLALRLEQSTGIPASTWITNQATKRMGLAEQMSAMEVRRGDSTGTSRHGVDEGDPGRGQAQPGTSRESSGAEDGETSRLDMEARRLAR